MTLEEAMKYATACHSALHRFIRKHQLEERCPVCGATAAEVAKEAA